MNKPTPIKPFWKYSVAMALCWVLVILSTLLFQLKQEKAHLYSNALNAARTAFQKDVAFRSWVAGHGGVYVPVTKDTQPNPYLDVANRDITTTTGQKLTLLNPAFAFRQVVEEYQDMYGIYGHLTSLKLKNPGNAPTPWERTALERFESEGIKEIWDVVDLEDKPILRMARPLHIQAACLNCHASQGYKLGEVRGAIVVTVPLRQYLETLAKTNQALVLTHAVFLVLGLGLIGILTKSLSGYLRKLFASESALQLHQEQLESEVRRRTQEANDARQKAEEATAYKAEFLANMSHEIRTPLTGVLGVTTLLEKTNLSQEQRELLATVQYSGEHLLMIVNEVLSFSKLEAGKLVLNFSLVSLSDLLESTLDMFALEAANKHVRLLYIIGANCPETIQTDKKRLQQVLINLISNSLKYTDSGEVVILVNPEQKKNKLKLSFSIVDTGSGISKDDQTGLFEAFTQASQGAKPGTGLGLKISKQLVTLMGGEISVTSELGQGTTFNFYIQSTVGPKQLSLPSQDMASLYEKVLIVATSSARFIEALTALLRPFNCQIIRVQSPVEAISVSKGKENLALMIDAPEIEEVDSLWLDQWDQLQMPIVVSVFLGSHLDLPEKTTLVHKPLKAQALYNALLQTKREPDQNLKPQHGNEPAVEASVLLVEDHEINQMIGKKILESIGYPCEVASNGLEAVAMTLAGHFDVILMDIRMPVMDGIEATKQILEKMPPERQPVVIAMTANVMEQDRETYLQAGMKDVLSKPLIPKELSSTLTHWSRERKKQIHIQLLGPNLTDADLLNQGTIQSRVALGGGFFPHLRDIYQLSGAQAIEGLGVACEQGDDLECIALAHQIKGLSENIGADLAAKICYQIELAANDGELDRLFELTGQLLDVFTETCKELQKVPD